MLVSLVTFSGLVLNNDMIRIQNISKYYQVGKQSFCVLSHIDLEIQEGEIFGIIGKSGAGKTSLIKCVNLLSMPSEGDILVGGKSTAHLQENELRKLRQSMGKIFQNFNLLRSRTVAKNIALPLEFAGYPKSEIDLRVNELLSLVRLSDQAQKYPNQLSGGQKQRVAIARALSTHPKILLSDEATSALDPTSTREILTLLKSINQKLGLTILMITHEMEVVKSICDRVAVLDEGKIIEQGAVLDLFTSPKQSVTKQLVKNISLLEVPPHIQNMLVQNPQPGAGRVVRLAYHGNRASQPIISYLIQQYRIIINILQGYIETIQNQPVGVMIIEIRGDEDSILKSIAFFESNGLQVETLGYVAPHH